VTGCEIVRLRGCTTRKAEFSREVSFLIVDRIFPDDRRVPFHPNVPIFVDKLLLVFVSWYDRVRTDKGVWHFRGVDHNADWTLRRSSIDTVKSMLSEAANVEYLLDFIVC